MREIVDSAQMRFCDGNTITYYKIPSMVLMERAALAVAGQITRRFPAGGSALVVCGNGNNGADGLAVARLLGLDGWKVTPVMPISGGRRTDENVLQGEILEQYGIKTGQGIPEDTQYDCIVDALFGIGLTRAPEGVCADVISRMNKLGGFKVAVDMPSGVSADTGAVLGVAFEADLTVTFAYGKVGQLLYPGAGLCGLVHIADIGIAAPGWLGKKPSFFAPEKPDLERLPKRPADSNKGTYGRLLVVAGSKNMAGAALFCAEAAYRAGCGLVRVCTDEENRAVIQGALPEAVLMTYEGGRRFKAGWLSAALEWADAVAAGPGLGTGKQAKALLSLILQHGRVPLILDADALNILSQEPELLRQFGHYNNQSAVTPHLGEMARLTGQTVESLKADLPGAAGDFAKKYRTVCVLKDARTVTALPDGTVYLNTSGCSAMAKGGSGDILTGLIAGLAVQGVPVQEAAPLGVYAHGLAGEAAAAECGERGVLARDILNQIAAVLS